MVNTQSRDPYNLPTTGGDADESSYNPKSDANFDDEDFDNEEYHPVGARGSNNQSTGRDYMKEDRETAQSEQVGNIPSREVDDLKSNMLDGEDNVSGYTRGKRVDAYQQERDVDRALDDAGIAKDDQNY